MNDPRRQLLQFIIKSVFLLATCVTCYFGGWASRQWQYEREKEQATPLLQIELSTEVPLVFPAPTPLPVDRG